MPRLRRTCCGSQYLDGVEDQNRPVLVRSASGELNEREALVGVVRIPLEVHVDRHLDGTGWGLQPGYKVAAPSPCGCRRDALLVSQQHVGGAMQHALAAHRGGEEAARCPTERPLRAPEEVLWAEMARC